MVCDFVDPIELALHLSMGNQKTYALHQGTLQQSNYLHYREW